MKLLSLILIGFFCTIEFIEAQSDYRPGYVITNSGDSIRGEIDYRGDLLMGSICKFRNSDGKITEYSPDEIVGYRFVGSKYYISREVDSKKIFLEYLIKGRISIYYLRDDNGDHYYLDRKGTQLTEIPYEEGIKYVGDQQYYYSSKKHFGLLYYYMQDVPNIQKKIQKVRTPQHQNLIKLAEYYNNAVCPGEKCIIYEDQQPFVKVNPELLAGIMNYDESKNKYVVTGGIIANLWLPRINEKIYLRTGLVYSTLKLDKENQKIYKLPIQIEYIYPKSMIRPKVSLGINLYSPFYQSVGFNGGFNIKLFKMASLSINYDIDFIPSEKFALLPENRLSSSILAGIYMTF